MSYNKKSPELKGYKKKEFPQDFRCLADIVGKCIICKDSAHDSISVLKRQIMTAITMEVKVNYGAVIFNWLANWFKDAAKRKKEDKPQPKMLFGRFIFILLKKKLGKYLDNKYGEPLNVNKKITKKLFNN